VRGAGSATLARPSALAHGVNAGAARLGLWPSRPNRREKFAPLFGIERRRLLDLLRSLHVSDWERPEPVSGLECARTRISICSVTISAARVASATIIGPRPHPKGWGRRDFISWLDDLQAEWVPCRPSTESSTCYRPSRLDWRTSGRHDECPGRVGTKRHMCPGRAVTPYRCGWTMLASSRAVDPIASRCLKQSGLSAIYARTCFDPVLDGLRWAYPFRLEPHKRPAGATVEVSVTGPEGELSWYLVSDQRRLALSAHCWRFQSSRSCT